MKLDLQPLASLHCCTALYTIQGRTKSMGLLDEKHSAYCDDGSFSNVNAKVNVNNFSVKPTNKMMCVMDHTSSALKTLQVSQISS